MTTKYRPVPTSLRGAFEQDKQYAATRKRLSVDRLADLHATTPSTIYKWLEEASMPVKHLAGWFNNTGSRSVIRFLAVQAGGVFIELPCGRHTDVEEVQQLQGVLHDAVGALLHFHAGRLDKDACLGQLTHALESMAWHRENVRKAEQPELEFGA